jgi:[ribosomal protein S5]-alanine N-acetyltransferase
MTIALGPSTTDRLKLLPLATPQLEQFHALVTDPDVRRYMMDGKILPQEWSEREIAASQARFAAGALGLWLAYLRDEGDEPIGFCGFLPLPEMGLGAELVYALRAAHAGRGCATEMAEAMIATARAHGVATIAASVDAVNAASVHILEKLGFRRTEIRRGEFGDLFVMQRAL